MPRDGERSREVCLARGLFRARTDTRGVRGDDPRRAWAIRAVLAGGRGPYKGPSVNETGFHASYRLYLSPVNVAEIRFGLELMGPGRQKQRGMAMLRRLGRKPQLRITVETAATFGALAAKLKKAGKDPDVRVNDLWLAAQAIQRDFGLLTSNIRDFADIPELRAVALNLP